MKLLTLLFWAIALLLSGCASGQGKPKLPYDSWSISMLAPNYMEVWVESVDVIDRRGLVFERVHGGTVAMRSPANNKGKPAGWPERPGGSSKSISGVDLPEFIFVRWQSLVEPQTYNVRIKVPEWVREEMVKPNEVADCSRKDKRLMIDYRRVITIGLAPGGIAKVWLRGGCLETLEIGRFVGAVSKKGPYGGQSGGAYYRAPSEAAQTYIEQFGIPYGSW